MESARSAIGISARERFLGMAGAELDRLYRLAGLILGNAAEAEDAVGDALLRGWQSLGSLRNVATFDAWLDRILVNVCRDRLRRRGRVRFIDLEASPDRPASGDAFRDLAVRDELLGALAIVPPDERIVLILHFWADLTLEAVAERLGWPLGTVKSRLHRGLGRVREALDAKGRMP